MSSSMQQISWEERERQVYIKFPIENGQEVSFRFPSFLINDVVANTPHWVYLGVVQEENEREFLLNFEGLRPVVSSDNHLKLKVGNSGMKDFGEHDFISSIGRFYIARGESYQERFLGRNGWQCEKCFFEMEDETAIKKTIQAPEASKPSAVSGSSLLTEKFKNCVACGEQIATSADICPKCQVRQYTNCSACGNKVAVGAGFCSICGNPVAASASSELTSADDSIDLGGLDF